MKLYSYFRSSAAYRVRIALNLKGLAPEVVPIHLLKDGGMQLKPEYHDINPQGLVPALEDQGQILSQSLAIIEYLDEVQPEPALLPGDALTRAHIRALSLSVACDIHPLNNLRVLRYLSNTLAVSDEQKNVWYAHWCLQGFTALEAMLAKDPRTGLFCVGDTPTMADCCLVPQVFNAQRFNIDLSAMPTVLKINEQCLQHPAFINAAPGLQVDAE